MLIVHFTTVDNNTFAYISHYRYTIVYKGKTMKQTFTTRLLLSIAALMSVLSISTAVVSPVSAADKKNMSDSISDNAPTCSILPQSICNASKTDEKDVKKTGVFVLLIWVLNIMTAGVGIAAVVFTLLFGLVHTVSERRQQRRMQEQWEERERSHNRKP